MNLAAELGMQIQDRLERLDELDDRIDRARSLERHALVRGMVLAVAMLTIMGAWSRVVDTVVLDVFKYGCAVGLVGAEYTIRRYLRHRLQDQQERLVERI